jgi:hypothetical protein
MPYFGDLFTRGKTVERRPSPSVFQLLDKLFFLYLTVHGFPPGVGIQDRTEALTKQGIKITLKFVAIVKSKTSACQGKERRRQQAAEAASAASAASAVSVAAA